MSCNTFLNLDCLFIGYFIFLACPYTKLHSTVRVYRHVFGERFKIHSSFLITKYIFQPTNKMDILNNRRCAEQLYLTRGKNLIMYHPSILSSVYTIFFSFEIFLALRFTRLYIYIIVFEIQNISF